MEPSLRQRGAQRGCIALSQMVDHLRLRRLQSRADIRREGTGRGGVFQRVVLKAQMDAAPA